MSVEERDPHSGHMLTGHEWNGIKEINRPVPKPVWAFIVVTVTFAVIMWLLMPAWPLITTYTKGLLHTDQRVRLEKQMQTANAQRADWVKQIEDSSMAAIMADAALMKIVRETGPSLFQDNCAACHGLNAKGGPGYPDLTDNTWLWGGDPDTVLETINVGINSTNQGTRSSQMQAWGRDGLLNRQQLLDVVAYVRSLSGLTSVVGNVGDGKAVFTANCVACHGPDGKGLDQFGAPDLTDGFWIYGSDEQSVYQTVYGGRQGVMPHWSGRLSDVQRKILAAYVVDLGKAAP